jgi:hypothetical protein
MQSVGVFEGYTPRGRVVFPDVKIDEAYIYTYARLRGYSFILGVFINGTPIGWVQTRADETANEFMERNAKQRDYGHDTEAV